MRSPHKLASALASRRSSVDQDVQASAAGLRAEPSQTQRVTASTRVFLAGPGRRLRRNWQWLALVPALVYVVVFFVRIGDILHEVYASSDVTGLLYLAQTFPSAPSGAKILYGHVQIWQVLGVLLSTRWLPDYRQIWEILPWVVSVVTLAMVARVVAMVSGRWAAMVVMVALGCAAPYLLALQFEWGVHTAAYADICVFGVLPPLMALREGRLGRSRAAWYIWLVLAVVVGAGGLNDNLFVLGGLIPFLFASAVTVALTRTPTRTRVLWSAAAVTIGLVVAAKLADVLAQHAGVTESSGFTPGFAPFNQLLFNAGLFLQALVYLFHGNFGGLPADAQGAIAVACAVVAIILLVVAYHYVRRQARALVPSLWTASAQTRDPQQVARIALTAYWASSTVLLGALWFFTTAPADVQSDRYLVTVAYAIVILAAVCCASTAWARNAATVAVCVLAIGGIVGVFHHGLYVATGESSAAPTWPEPADGAALADWAQAEHLTYGYASYWDAYPLSWWAHSRVGVFPVQACSNTLCSAGNQLDSWYQNQPHTRSFLVVDNHLLQTQPAYSLGVSGPPVAFGHPSSVAHVRDMTIYVYPYDVASRFGPLNG
jgi:hypothetical protein